MVDYTIPILTLYMKNIIKNIIALTICKYTLPKNFIKTFLLILVLIKTIFNSYIVYGFGPATVLESTPEDTSIKENKVRPPNNLIFEIPKTRLNHFMLTFLMSIIYHFILGYIMRSYYPNVENNYKIFSIPFLIYI